LGSRTRKAKASPKVVPVKQGEDAEEGEDEEEGRDEEEGEDEVAGAVSIDGGGWPLG
jgi:hypothetical protein